MHCPDPQFDGVEPFVSNSLSIWLNDKPSSSSDHLIDMYWAMKPAQRRKKR
jgi:hypothetical protein